MPEKSKTCMMILDNLVCFSDPISSESLKSSVKAVVSLGVAGGLCKAAKVI